jgi:endonuclease G
MFDYRLLFADPAIRQEFQDRADELIADAQRRSEFSGLEGLEGGLSRRAPADAVESMLEGRWTREDGELEAIIRRFARPVYYIRNATAIVTSNDAHSSEVIAERLRCAEKQLAESIPSVGRIELRNHRLEWVGTGWLVRPDIVVTNRHVAEEFGRRRGGGFGFRSGPAGTLVRANLDCCREYGEIKESRFRVTDVLWIEPDGSVDVAVIRISPRDENGAAAPPPIPLMNSSDLNAAGIGAWVAVIGYPAYDNRCDSDDQRRIFDGIYGVKRIAPGQITGLISEQILHHDATTLGGNSGSLVLDLASGRAAAIHFGGLAGERNLAVQAPVITRVLEDNVSDDIAREDD